MPDIAVLGANLGEAIRAYGMADPRSQQSRDGILGPSDLGFCRMKALLTLQGVADTDEKSIIAAQIGTAIHHYAAKAFAAWNPDWITDNLRIEAKFPSGAAISGTPDLISPDYNAITDVKTVDGLQKVKREGPSMANRFQRHTYALAAIQAGLLDGSRPVYVCNLYIDRSGDEDEPYFTYEEFDPGLTAEVDSWIQDVIYAHTHNEEAMRDVAAPVCEAICQKFTACRGGLGTREGVELITDTDTLASIRLFTEGRDMEKIGKKMRDEAKSLLKGISGTDGTWQLRWTHVDESSVGPSVRSAHEKFEVVKVRR